MIDDNAPQDIGRKTIVSMAYVIPGINDFPRIGYRNTLILFKNPIGRFTYDFNISFNSSS